MKRYAAGGVLAAMSMAMLVGCGGSSGSSRDIAPSVTLDIISSAPDQVSGGDVRIGLHGDDAVLSALTLRLNGESTTMQVLVPGDGMLEGLVEGLAPGDNQLEVVHPQFGVLADQTLVNHPITGPMFSGPQQYPFVCMTVHELGIQPLVDDGATEGFPVLDDEDNVIGYSRDCSIEPYVEYWYRTTGNSYALLPLDGSRPANLAMTTLMDGREVDFIVRWERGTINRFIYSYAMLATLDEANENPGALDTDLWNGRLLYRFQGGVGIGHSQGRVDRDRRALHPEVLGLGYAIAYSTGNRTGEHYNLELGAETALMVKEHFIKRYGAPLYTVGLGASGGGIQQYMYAQNAPGLIDAGVPVQAYTDMVTQTIHIGDCELLEHYMDVTDADNEKWHTTAHRSWLVGLHATDNVPDPMAAAKQMLNDMAGTNYGIAPGSTECIESWRGLTPLALNPHFGSVREQQKMQPSSIMDNVHWTHTDDLVNIYGRDDTGHARSLFDNVGVQYGLQALLDGHITGEEFLDLNAKVGGWKHPSEMVQEGFPFIGSIGDVQSNPSHFDPWSRRNMNLSAGDTPAPRTEGDILAMNAAYESGMVFQGHADIPLIDWRPYLEEVLDMHNVHQSFALRQRMLDAVGHHDNQVIWFTDARGVENNAFDQTPMALAVIDEWMTNIRENPELSVAENKPAAAVDSCFDNHGQLIAADETVWNGILDGEAEGACTATFPIYTTSRIVAGAPIQGDFFKCALKPVQTALADGTYGDWAPSAEEITRLEAIFPDGVCDYSQLDVGRP
ncbi:DUF6351 family protein [Isoalcanivorax indicus]|uniref:DUF6351 family protein n=1 Tax=Isoalcanivorax indicus TaxID=2202653 RepID=UPI000DB93161|nr:DUF6351 family protein [Isoalcanivorax indicus]